MKQIINAKIVIKDGVIEGKTLLFSEKIEDIIDNPREDTETVDADGLYLIPGFIDLHIHGYGGADASDGTEESLDIMSKGIIKNGVTAFLPTTMTLSYPELYTAFDAIRHYMKIPAKDGAEVLGAHAEGPFISEKRKGAQDPVNIKKIDPDFVIGNSDVIKIITLAPEEDDDFAGIIKIKKETGTVLSIGHTNADFNTAVRSFKAGITHATHLFNAMTPITHREPGASGASLFSENVSCELICDTFHVHPALFPAVHKIKGCKLNLITDSLRCAGLPDGNYESGGLSVSKKGIECRLSDGTIAGSVLKLNEAVRNLNKAGIPLYEAVNCASLYPAMTLGVDGIRGQIKKGLLADFSLCDGQLNVNSVYKRGKKVF